MSKPSIGWIGLGHMGIPMAANLVKAGFPVTVYNRSPGKADGVFSSVAKSPAELAKKVDIVITMVSDDSSQESVLCGPNGVVEGAHDGLIVINMGTVSPAASKNAAEILGRHGVKVLDAPVSGSVKPAQDGTLVILVGGEAITLERCQPIFDVLGKKTFHFGAHGAGSTAKLAINMLLGVLVDGLAETVTFGEGRGLDRALLLEMIGETACAAPIITMKIPSVKAGSYPAAFPLKHMAKDFRLAIAEAGDISLPTTKIVGESFAKAEAKGFGDDDVMSVIKILEK